jgi:2-polyprenyl-3-methyl-5-hydroxy-6-metoxy-1,4-benzoquinol methylase
MTFDRSQELDFLNSLVADYKDQSPYSRIKKDIIQNLILKSTSNRQSIKVLQLGCSNGYESDFLVKNFGDVTIVDGSSLFIEKLQKDNSNKSVKYVHALFEDLLSVLDEKYDVICCNYILEHVYDSGDILRILRNMLSENGYLFVVVPNANALSRQIACEMKLLVNLTDLTENDLRHGHRRVYSSDTLRDEVATAGFEIVQMKGIVLKILADFQLNKLLTDGFLTQEHIEAMQRLAEKPENFELSDSLFVQLKAS